MTPKALSHHERVTLRVYRPWAMGWYRWGLYQNGQALRACPQTMISSNSHMPYVPTREFDTSPVTKTIAGRCVFGGVFYTHFGHFLTETLISLAQIASLADDYDHIICLASPNETKGHLPDYVMWFLSELGIDPKKIIVAHESLELEGMDLPPSPFIRKARYDGSVVEVINTLSMFDVPYHGQKLYVSRRNVDAKRQRLMNGDALEALFVEHGYRAIIPEGMPLKEQIPLLLGASALAGENGSGLHWSLLSPHIKTVFSLGWHLPLQHGICAARQQTYVNVRAPWLGPFLPRKQTVPMRYARRVLENAM